jgi:hypothetical protein
MAGDQLALFKDLDLVSQAMDLDGTLLRGVGHRVVIPVNADHPFTAELPFQFENGSERYQRQAQQCRSFVSKGFVDDAPGRCMDTRIGDIGKPACQLRVQVIDIAKDGSQKKVFANIAERALDFSFLLSPELQVVEIAKHA